MYKSTSIDPLDHSDLRSEHLPGGARITRNREGQIVRTCDALGIRRDFGREELTRRLLVRKHGVWTKLDGGCLDESGTLFYRRGDVEIQERLNGTHVHTNRQTGVMIQTDHVNHSEIMKQANGELWKREVDEVRELFEMWVNGKLSFRTIAYYEPARCQATTPSGVQPLVYVCRLEQSWANGHLTREKFAFKNPLNQQREVALTVPVNGKLITIKNVAAVVTTFAEGNAVETCYELNGGTHLRADIGGMRREIDDVERVRQFASEGEQCLGFATTSGAESVFTAF